MTYYMHINIKTIKIKNIINDEKIYYEFEIS